MRVFARLLSSGLPVTWTTIRLMWQAPTGFPASIPHITREELLAYAMGRIGYGLPEQEELVAELAFANPRDTWTIQRLLKELAPFNPEALQSALRVWRWTLLNEIVAENERQCQAAPDEHAKIYGIWTDDFTTSVYCSFRDFWEEFDLPSEAFAVTQDWQSGGWFKDIPSTSRFIAEHRRWLSEEVAELRKMDSAA